MFRPRRSVGFFCFVAGILILGYTATVGAQAAGAVHPVVITADAAIVSPACFDLPAATRGETEGVLWANHPERKTISCTFEAVDLSPYRTVTLRLHSAAANNALLTFVISSENPETDGVDYYRYDIRVGWKGDQEITFDLSKAIVARSPIGWHRIDAIRFWADFGGIHPPPDTEITIWGIEFR